MAEGPEKSEQPKNPKDLDADLAEMYQLAILCFNRGSYGRSLHLLSQITKLKPSFVDTEDLRARVAVALDQQQRDLVFDATETEADRALQERRWDDIPGIISALHVRLEAENLTLDDEQRAAVNRWEVSALRGGRSRRTPQRRRQAQQHQQQQPMFKSAARPPQPSPAGPVHRVSPRPTIGERLAPLPRYLVNLAKDYLRDQAWIPWAVLAAFLATTYLISYFLQT